MHPAAALTKGNSLSQKTGRILLLLGMAILAVIGLIQLIRSDYLSAGICFFSLFFGVLAYVLNRRANNNRL